MARMSRKAVLDKLDSLINQASHVRLVRYDDVQCPLFKDDAVSFVQQALGEQEEATLKAALKWPRRSGLISRLISPPEEHHDAIDRAQNLLIVFRARVERGEYTPPTPRRPKPISLFDSLKLHPRVVGVARPLFADGHYAQAIFEAFKAVNNMVKDKSGLADLDGKQLMGRAFDESHPVIKVSRLRDRSEKDEQEGFKFLFMGSTLGIRNPKAHTTTVQTDPFRTLEYLALASLLAKRLDEAQGKGGRTEARWDRERFLAALAQRSSPEEIALAEDLMAFGIEVSGNAIEWGAGKDRGSFTARLTLGSERFSLFSVYTTGQFSLNIGWNQERLSRFDPHISDKYRAAVKGRLSLHFDRNTWERGWPMASLSVLIPDKATGFKDLVSEFVSRVQEVVPEERPLVR